LDSVRRRLRRHRPYKNRNTVAWFVLGVLFSIISILIVAVLPKQLPKAPAGMDAFRCRRCNAVQNVAIDEIEYQCWQCEQVNSLI
jgi:hypothetical protein